MKRKIALLLAFTMILSILPMTVAGQVWGTRSTGSMAEVTGPGTVRHWYAPGERGVIVARPVIANQRHNMTLVYDNREFAIAGAETPALRNVAVGLDYFASASRATTTMAAIRVDLNSSAHTWALGHGAPDVRNGDNDMIVPAGLRASWLTALPYLEAFAGIPVGTTNLADPASRLALAAELTTGSQVADLAGWMATAPLYVTVSDQTTVGGGIQWLNEGAFIAVLVPTGRRSAEMLLFNLTTNVDTVDPATGNAMGFITTPAQMNAAFNAMGSLGIPIEYVTAPGANDAAVVLSFNTRGWPSIPNLNLTTVVDSRFSIHRGGDLRTFHRYGRVQVDRIEIREVVSRAFNHPDWHVRADIVTAGFEWSTLCESSQIREYPTTAGLGVGNWNNARLLVGINVESRVARRYDINDRLTAVFNVPNYDNPHRLDRARVDIGGGDNPLFIVANDRARPGDVEVEVTMWRAQRGTVAGSTGRWDFNVIDNVGALVPTAIINEAWLAARWTNAQRSTPTVPGNASIVHVVTHPSAAVPATGPGGPSVAGFYTLEWRWTPDGGVLGNWANIGGENGYVVRQRITVAQFGEIGLELELHEDDDLEDFWLRSGVQEWGNRAVFDDTYHLTARAVLRETVAGSLPGTGAHPTTFTFNEGIQVLGARIWTNEAHFSTWDDDEGVVWFGDNQRGSFLNTTIGRNYVTIRPEIGRGIERRWRRAEVTIEFYLSVQPNYEGLFGEDIDVTVTSGTIERPFEDSLTIAHAWDPITVDTSPVSFDGAEVAAFGVVRGASLGDVVITEVGAGVLEPGTRLWLGVEGGISRSWGTADHISLYAGNVTTNDPTLQFTQPRVDSHGTFIEITRASRYDGAQITFSNVQISGRVIPGQSYNIFVAEDAVAANWEGFAWMRVNEWTYDDFILGPGRFTRGALHGYFTPEPYATLAFDFEGSDIFAPPVAPPPSAQDPISGPVTFHLNSSHITRDGDVVAAPVFVLVPNITNPNYVTSYVAVRVVADLAGFPWGPGQSGWDPASQTATFTNGSTTIVFTANSTSATVNGIPTPITAGGLGADARIIGDRMFVPISFFNTLPVPVSVVWNPYTNVAQRSITVFPAPAAVTPLPAPAPVAAPVPAELEEYLDEHYGEGDYE